MAAEFIERRIQSNGNTTNVNINRDQPYIDTIINGKKARVYGSQEQLDEYQNKKPDGTKIAQTNKVPANASKGMARFAEAYNKAVNKIKDGKSSVTTPPETTSGSQGQNLQNLVPNPLLDFASYTPLWTLAVLTPQQFNNPTSYRTDDLSFAKQTFDIQNQVDSGSGDGLITQTATLESGIVFSSGGRDSPGSTSRVNTAYGRPEFYVDNFRMKAVVSATEATGNSNATGFEFEIYEPYSMGLLLQSMQTAAIKAGYANYLNNAAFLLRLDFKGFKQDGTVFKSVKPKFFPMKLTEVKFEVDEGGSKYNVKAIPYNHGALSDNVDLTFKDIKIAAPNENTVEEMLVTGDRSLVSILKKAEEENVKNKMYSVEDIYEVQFPKSWDEFIAHRSGTTEDKGATNKSKKPTKSVGKSQPVTKNEFGENGIGKATFAYSAETGGNFDFSKEGDVYNEETGLVERDKMTINPKTRVFSFTQEQKLTDIIVQVILSSTYAKQALDPANLVDGFIKWFRLDVQIEFLDYDILVADFAKKYTFRVVPFFVHHSIFNSPTSANLGYSELEKKIVKRYDYIYTGQNQDIIRFDIAINNLFYTGGASNAEKNTSTNQTNDQQGTASGTKTKTETTTGSAAAAQTANLGKSKKKSDPALFKNRKGGSGQNDVEKQVAETFHEAFLNGSSADLVTVDLEILGDTYWMVDSGMGNYFAKPSSQSDLITNDGTANYEGQDCYIYISFRTPADVDTKAGLYQFNRKGVESPFSGIYQVTMVENKFENGTFTQNLKCLRKQGQPIDYEGKPIPQNKQEAVATKVVVDDSLGST
jgi:hypothetical protein